MGRARDGHSFAAAPGRRRALTAALGTLLIGAMGLKVNLGCGQKYYADYVNCDVLRNVKADKYFDLNAPPYPFAEDSADEILLDNVLEHLDDIPRIMEELHRILRVGGVLRIFVPYGKSDWALQDPTHKHYFTENSMNYFCEGHPYAYYSGAKFHVRQARLFGDSTTLRHKLRNLLPAKAWLKYFWYNIYDGIYFELEKRGVR
jgi:SAM-dependent methyltransferase